MTKSKLLKQLNLSNDDMQEIKDAVKNAESKTVGEIALAIVPESDSYSFWELLASICVAAVVTSIALTFAPNINAIYEKANWDESIYFLPLFYSFAFFAIIFICFFMMNIPTIDRLIIPKAKRNKAVTNRAFRHFAESGVYETKEHSGILIFVSHMEKQVRIIADVGIAKKIPQDLWEIIVDEIVSGIKTKKAKDGFVSAIEKCGELLTEHFPCNGENSNELSDGLVILDE